MGKPLRTMGSGVLGRRGMHNPRRPFLLKALMGHEVLTDHHPMANSTILQRPVINHGPGISPSLSTSPGRGTKHSTEISRGLVTNLDLDRSNIPVR
ncbi:hypothetical protein [Corynebacterium kroppenstedtii]|uniref:hypothetical protein n=1 Tax=Corynebacterium kroppenstedtii TaxID=161879 RepID=UPI003872EFB1